MLTDRMPRHETFEKYGKPLWLAKFEMFNGNLKPLAEAVDLLDKVPWNFYHTSTYQYDRFVEKSHFLKDIAIYQKKFHLREKQMLLLRIEQVFNLFQKLVLGVQPPSTNGYGPWRTFTIYAPIFWSFYASIFLKKDCYKKVYMDMFEWNTYSFHKGHWTRPEKRLSPTDWMIVKKVLHRNAKT